jgi:hypothetical protein
MMTVIPPKYAISRVMGYIKGNSAIHLARVYAELLPWTYSLARSDAVAS